MYLVSNDILHLLDEQGIPLEECTHTFPSGTFKWWDEEEAFYALATGEIKLCTECAQASEAQDLMAQVREDLDAGPPQGV